MPHARETLLSFSGPGRAGAVARPARRFLSVLTPAAVALGLAASALAAASAGPDAGSRPVKVPPGMWDAEKAEGLEKALDAFFAGPGDAERARIFRDELLPRGVGLSLDELVAMGKAARPAVKRSRDGSWPIRCPWLPGNVRGWFKLAMPARYTPRKAWPLAVALHGRGKNGSNLVSHYTPKLNTLGYFVVYPTTTDVRHYWGAKAQVENVFRIVTWVAGRYRIDFRRLAVTGGSMGGTATWSHALKRPGLWNTAAVVSGFPVYRGNEALERLRGVNLLIMHGARDSHTPIGPTRRIVKQLKERKIPHRYIEIADSGHTPPRRYWSAMCAWIARQRPKAWSPRPVFLPPASKTPRTSPAP